MDCADGAPPVFDDAFAAGFERLLQWRRDVRHFGSRAVGAADFAELLRCAALAPSVGNAQPWRFVRVRTPALRETLAGHVDAESARAAAAYDDEDQRGRYRSLKLHGLREAPEIVAVYCDENPGAGHGLGRATMPEMLRYSCVLAIHSLWLAARLRGIGVGWVSILDPLAVRDMLAVPANWSLIAVLCIGYPARAAATPELERNGWQSREPITQRVYER